MRIAICLNGLVVGKEGYDKKARIKRKNRGSFGSNA